MTTRIVKVKVVERRGITQSGAEKRIDKVIDVGLKYSDLTDYGIISVLRTKKEKTAKGNRRG